MKRKHGYKTEAWRKHSWKWSLSELLQGFLDLDLLCAGAKCCLGSILPQQRPSPVLLPPVGLRGRKGVLCTRKPPEELFQSPPLLPHKQ